MIRFPRWGIRMKCDKIPNPALNMSVLSKAVMLKQYSYPSSVPVSPTMLTYVYTPRSTLRGLFEYFNTPLPDELQSPLNLAQVLQGNDSVPDELNVQETAMGGECNEYNMSLHMPFDIKTTQPSFGIMASHIAYKAEC
jgi:hypothetical protein